MVAVDEPAGVVDRQHAVGIAVERETDIGARCDDARLQRLGVRRPATGVDVHAVGLRAQHLDGASEPRQHVTRDVARRAVGAVDHDGEPVEPAPFERGDEVVEIGRGRVESAQHTADGR